MKILWHCLKGEHLWSMVIKAKYIKFWMVTQWFQKLNKYVSKASIILRNLRKDFSILSKTILWRIGTGTEMMLGIGPFIGDEGNYALSSAFISVSNRKIIMYLDKDRRTNSLGEDSSYCLSYVDLELNGDQVVKWENYVSCLKRDGIVLNNEEDRIVWESNSSIGPILAKIVHMMSFLYRLGSSLSNSGLICYGNGKYL